MAPDGYGVNGATRRFTDHASLTGARSEQD